MQTIFLLISLSLSLTASLQCGFRIQSVRSGQPSCYLQAGHLADNTVDFQADMLRHNLDNIYTEYNVFWQCTSGGSAPRVWYFENGRPGNKLYTKLPWKPGAKATPIFYLEADTHHDQGVGVDRHEFNAKVDQILDHSARIGLYTPTGAVSNNPTGLNLLGYRHQKWYLGGNNWVILQRDTKEYQYKYELIASQIQVTGYEAQWEFYADDAGQKGDNYVRLLPMTCGSDADPSPNSNPSPSSVIIELPAQTLTYFVGVLFVLVLVNLVCCIYSNKWKSSGKGKYKTVRYESETDAV